MLSPSFCIQWLQHQNNQISRMKKEQIHKMRFLIQVNYPLSKLAHKDSGLQLKFLTICIDRMRSWE